jgi:uncharacterized protein
LNTTNKLKIFNDPIYGFISIPNSLIYDIIQHPYFQRLRRISQMGLSYLVYPGAHHTRFHHALGAMHIMQKAVEVLRYKGVAISDEEENALYCAILLHDIGHGPFSHALEHSIVAIHHEELSLQFMKKLNDEFDNKLALAIQIFKGQYHRKFMLQLISSQLDMDRMDYLKRDSFYSGVAEGNINSDRLIQMMNVVDDELVMEEKGIYSIEKFLMARRLMYWQAYLHKTSLVAELMLTKVLKRANELVNSKVKVACSSSLLYFMENSFNDTNFSNQSLEVFSKLDDFDVVMALKEWQNHDDFILRTLSQMIINRDLLKIQLTNEKIATDYFDNLTNKVAQLYSLSLKQAEYFVYKGKIKNQAYKKDIEPIRVLRKDKTIDNIIDVSDQLSLKALSKPVTKYFVCFPKVLLENGF